MSDLSLPLAVFVSVSLSIFISLSLSLSLFRYVFCRLAILVSLCLFSFSTLHSLTLSISIHKYFSQLRLYLCLLSSLSSFHTFSVSSSLLSILFYPFLLFCLSFCNLLTSIFLSFNRLSSLSLSHFLLLFIFLSSSPSLFFICHFIISFPEEIRMM